LIVGLTVGGRGDEQYNAQVATLVL